MSSTLASPSTPSTAEPEFVTYDDCVPLHVLAEFMRDGEWLDVMTGQGLLTRVRIVQVIVGRRREEIVFKQQWLEENAKHTWPRTQRVIIDGWDIWQVRPTCYTPDEVTPWGVEEMPAQEKPAAVELGDDLSRAVAEGIMRVAAERYNTTVDELKKVNNYRTTAQRYVTMLVMFEMTDLGPNEITAQFGYLSPMPLVCARDRLGWYVRDPTRNKAEHVRPQTVRELAKMADKHFKPERYRSSRTWPGSYKPVLR